MSILTNKKVLLLKSILCVPNVPWIALFFSLQMAPWCPNFPHQRLWLMLDLARPLGGIPLGSTLFVIFRLIGSWKCIITVHHFLNALSRRPINYFVIFRLVSSDNFLFAKLELGKVHYCENATKFCLGLLLNEFS